MNENAVNDMPPCLCLASASPRRAELLRQLHLNFQQTTVDLDEQICVGEEIADYAMRMAKEKAKLAWQNLADKSDVVVLSADTCGEIAGELLLKPRDFSDAKRLLKLLSGNVHTIYSAFALFDGVRLHVENVVSTVTFFHLTDTQIERYWQTGEPVDKAGAYGIQGIGAQFVKHLSGSYSAVMGLPLAELAKALANYEIRTL